METVTRIIAAAGTAAAVLATTGCMGSGPTVEGFCSTYHKEKVQFTSKYASSGRPIAQNDPHATAKIVVDLLMAVQSLGDAKVILQKLDDAAPKDIKPDMDTVLESWKSTQGTLGDEASHIFSPTSMFGDVIKGMLASVESNGSWQRVGDYITKNCQPV